jgi:hypothetical protein
MSTYTPRDFGAKVRAVIAALDAALARGVMKAATLTSRRAIANLSGGRKAEPWTYPVPIRTPGGLRAQQQMQMESPTSAYVFNTAAYAGAISSGYVSSWAGRGKHIMVFHKPRLFIDDAVETEQPLMVIQNEVVEAIGAWA